MTQRNQKIVQPAQVRDVNVIDLILLDHKYLKDCIKVLKDEDAEKKKKMTISKGFLDALTKHSLAEKKAIYAPLESNAELHFNILEAEIEHGIVDKKVSLLKRRLTHARVLSDETEAELKVLAELVEHHLKEEESEMLPKMKDQLSDEELNQFGVRFMKLRKFTEKDLFEFPVLEDQLIQWKDSVQKLSTQFLSKMDRYVENLKH
jgi:hemerythrin-like domain-containing protein